MSAHAAEKLITPDTATIFEEKSNIIFNIADAWEKDKHRSDLNRMIKAQLIKYDDNPSTYLSNLSTFMLLSYALNVNT